MRTKKPKKCEVFESSRLKTSLILNVAGNDALKSRTKIIDLLLIYKKMAHAFLIMIIAAVFIIPLIDVITENKDTNQLND